MIKIGTPGTRVVEVDGCSFTVRHQDFMDLYRAISMNEEAGTLTRDASAIAGMYAMIMFRVVGWSGIGMPDGAEAECTEENKRLLFGQRPDLLRSIADRLEEMEEADSKN